MGPSLLPLAKSIDYVVLNTEHFSVKALNW